MTITNLSQSLASAATETNQAPQVAPAPLSNAQPSMADLMAMIQQLAANQSQPAPKGKKAKAAAKKAEKLAPSIPEAPKGFKWEEGVSGNGKAFRQCGFAGSDWKLRYYPDSKSLGLVHGRNFIYASGIAALEALADNWPEGMAAIVAADGE